MTSIFDRRLNGVAIYNPDLLSKEELVAQFVARRRDFEQMTTDLARPRFGQHQLIVGHRGMGKTTLLRRIRYAVEDDPKLAKTWMPLTFPEEQYNVSRLSDFYVNCIDALSDALEQAGRRDEAARLDAAVDELPSGNEEKRAADALAVLLGAADRMKKRLLLLVDNFDLIIERLSKDEQAHWALRELLSREHRLLLIAASPVVIGSTVTYGAPFYDFLQSRSLGGLTFEETHEVLSTLAKELKQPGVLAILEHDPARIRTLHVLAGGNPRTIVLLFGVLAQGADGDVRGDLERLLDQCTPLYKSRFEAMPAQAQQVVDALAIHWDPISAGELAETLHLDVNTISSQLNRLAQQGVVDKVEYDPETKTGFQIAERFFNIWYLMRASRRVRRRLIWFVEFLKLFYGIEQLLDRARDLAKASPRADLRHVELCLAIAEALPMHRPEQVALESRAIRAMLENASLQKQIYVVLDLEGADASLKPIVDRQQWAAELRRAVLTARTTAAVANEELYDLISGSPTGTREEKLKTAQTLDQMSEELLNKFVEGLQHERVLLASWLGDRLADAVRRAFRDGHVETLFDVDGLMAAAVTYGDPALEVVCDAGRFTSSELFAIYERCHDAFIAEILAMRHIYSDNIAASDIVRTALVNHPNRPRLRALGACLNIEHRAGEAIERELEILAKESPNDRSIWMLLGYYYHDRQQWSDAVRALKEATDLFPDDALLHYLLAESLFHDSRMDEARMAIQHAINRDPNDVDNWELLSRICGVTKDYDEAVVAARRCLAFASENIRATGILAVALIATNRVEEAIEPALVVAQSADMPVEVRAFMLGVYSTGGNPDSALPILEQLVRSGGLSDQYLEYVMRTAGILAHMGYGERTLQCIERAGKIDEFRPIYEALRIHVSGKRSQLRRLSPELRQPVEAILNGWNGGSKETSKKPKPRRRRR